jgi:hypothetical protein
MLTCCVLSEGSRTRRVVARCVVKRAGVDLFPSFDRLGCRGSVNCLSAPMPLRLASTACGCAKHINM